MPDENVRIVRGSGRPGRGVPAGGDPGDVLVRGVGPDYTAQWTAPIEGTGDVTTAALAAETAARVAGDADLAADIATEETARAAGDATNAAAITAETSARGTAVTAEATARAAADSTLTTNLATETAARIAADATLTTADTTEATARAAADTTLTTNLATEVTNRTNADALLIPLTQKGAANGVASLGSDSKIPSAQIPSLAISDVFVVASQAAMLALSSAGVGDVAKRTDNGKTFILSTASYSTLADWIEITDGAAVTSVDGATGAVSLAGTYATLAAASTLTTNLATEVTNRTNADSTLTTNLAAEATLARNADNLTSGTVADARIASTIARDSEVTSAVAAEATLARNADNLTSGTVADARIASTIARDSEVTAAVAAEAALRTTADTTEATARAAADTTLTTNLTAEAATRLAADVALAAADAALDTRVDALEAAPGGSGGGTSAEVTVAASDAPAAILARADYVCDGTADEVQINTALALGGKVVLSDGTFSVNAPIKVERWGQELAGSGLRYTGSAFGGASTAGTLIRPSASFTGAAVVKVEKDSNNYIVGMAHVHGFSIDGQLETVETYDGILFRSFRGSLHDVDVQHCTQDGIRVVGNETPNGSWATYDTRVYSINCSNNGRYGLHLVDSSAQDTHISQAILEDNLTGLYLGGASHQIVSMHSYGNTQYGVLSDTGGGARTKFIGCKIEHSGRHGVYFNGSTNPVQVQFVGSNFSSNGETTHNTYDHISVATGSANLMAVSGCTFATTDGATNIARYCINIGALAPNTSITGNTIDDGAFATGALNYTVNGGTTEATLKCYGNQEIQDFSGSGLVTLSAGAQAGTSPPSPVRGTNARNSKGTLTFGTGSGPSAGIMVTVTFDTAEIARPGNTVTAQFWVNPLNAATAALNPYIIPTLSGTTTSGFTINFPSAPAASQANTVYSVSWGMKT